MQQPMMQQPMKKSRPGGVTLLAVLALIGGVLTLIGGVGIVALGGLATAGGAAIAADPSLAGSADAAAAIAAASQGGSLIMILGIVAIVLGLLGIISAIGLFGLKKWGLTLTVVTELASIGLTLFNMTQGQPLNVVGLAIPVLIILYLLTPNVRQAFN
jgi:uncharacterized membrane protein (DUF2068 family)